MRDFKKDEVALSVPASAMVTSDLVEALDAGRSGWCACCQRGRTAREDYWLWSAFAAPSDAERLQARRMQQNTGTQLLVNILQKRKKVDGGVKRGHGLADEMAGREDERPPPGRLVAPGTATTTTTMAAAVQT